MDDYIKREDAIDYLTTNMNWFDADGIETSEEEKRADITELVNGVSSTDVAPVRHERWVTTDENIGGHCSNCGMECSSVEWGDDYLMKPTWNYCPNCGARMDGEDDEID